MVYSPAIGLDFYVLPCGVVRVKSIAPGKSAAVDGRIRKHDVLFSFNGTQVGSLGYTKVCVCVCVKMRACARARARVVNPWVWYYVPF